MRELTQTLSTLVVAGLCLFAVGAAGQSAASLAARLAGQAKAPVSSFELAAAAARFIDDASGRPSPLSVGR